MRRPRRLILATILGLLVFGYFLLWLTSPAPGMNRRGFDLVRPGMSEAEVIAILGAEPGDYINGYAHVDCNTGPSAGLSDAPNLIPISDFRRKDWLLLPGIQRWSSNDGVILIRFDADRLVRDKSFRSVVPETEPFLAKLRRWFLLQA